MAFRLEDVSRTPLALVAPLLQPALLKSSGLNAPTTAVLPFLGFVESGFPFTHNGGAAPTWQAAMGHNALFAQQIHFEVDLFARPIVGMYTRYHKGPISQ
ncbi:unnamed protein product [Victoria cruziana]